MNKMIARILSLALAVTCFSQTAYAEGAVQGVRISYIAEGDERFGSPGALDPSKTLECETVTIAAGEGFSLAPSPVTDSTIAIEKETDAVYVGAWTFSGWTVPDAVSTKEVEPDTEDPELEKILQTMGIATGGRVLFCSYQDAVIAGRWTFTPERQLFGPDKIEVNDALPLSTDSAALTEYWPERETELDKVYATGLLSDSIVQFMRTNSKTTPLQDRSFASVELSEAERIDFLTVVKETYETLTAQSVNAYSVANEIESIMTAAPSDHAGIETAFVVYCAEKAGLLEGKSRALKRTADISELYDFLKYDACADIITADELLQVYCSEDGETATDFTYHNTTVNLAHDDNWYDASNGKNAIQPGDLIVFKDERDIPMSVGVIDSVEGRSITYVMCGHSGIPVEYSFDEDDLLILGQMGTRAEIIGLRSCDISRIIYHFLVNEMKLPESSALGIMGNLYYESDFNTTALGDENTSFGICQWHNERFLELVIFCMKNNFNIASLEGQLRFLAYDLRENCPVLLSQLAQGEVSVAWAREAGYRFCRGYEQPAELELSSAYRGAVASGALWNDYSRLFLSEIKLENMQLSKEPVQSAAQAMTEGTQSAIQQPEETAQPVEESPAETPQPVTEQSGEEAQPVPEQPHDTMQPDGVQQVTSISYTVRPGDTMASICAGLGIDYVSNRDAILFLNNMSDDTILSIGQTIIFLNWMQIGNGQR